MYIEIQNKKNKQLSNKTVLFVSYSRSVKMNVAPLINCCRTLLDACRTCMEKTQ